MNTTIYWHYLRICMVIQEERSREEEERKIRKGEKSRDWGKRGRFENEINFRFWHCCFVWWFCNLLVPLDREREFYMYNFDWLGFRGWFPFPFLLVSFGDFVLSRFHIVICERIRVSFLMRCWWIYWSCVSYFSIYLEALHIVDDGISRSHAISNDSAPSYYCYHYCYHKFFLIPIT